MTKRKGQKENPGKKVDKQPEPPERLRSASTLYRGASYLNKTEVKTETKSLAERLKDLMCVFMQCSVHNSIYA